MSRSGFARTLILVALLLFTAWPALGATAATPQTQSPSAIVDWFVDWFTGLHDVNQAASKSVGISTDTDDDDTSSDPYQTFSLTLDDPINSETELEPHLDPNG